MEYELTSSMNKGILEITIPGKGGKKNASEIVLRVIDLVKISKPRCVLIDIQSIQGRIDITDIFHLVHDYPDDTPRIMTAIVDREGNRRQTEMDFLETVSVNVGYSTRYFTDIDAARVWLGA